MKKTFKRLGAVLLAAFMMLSTTVCALADEPNDANSQDQIADTKLVITDISDGDTVTAYQLVTYTADKNNYQMDPNFEDFFNAKKGQDQSVVEYLESLSNAQITALMEEYATSKEYSLPKPYNDGSNNGGKDGSKQADSSKSVTFNLKLGYYLFTTTTSAGSNKIYMPLTAFVKIDGTNTSVYAGNGTKELTASQDGSYQITAKSTDGITIDKKTNATQGDGNKTWKPTAAAGVGATVRFYVRVDIPAYNNQVTVNLDVKDTLTNMEYTPNSAVVYEEEPNLNNPTNMGTKIEDAVSVQPGEYNKETGKQDLSFTLTYDKITKNDTSKAKSVYLYYEAVVKPEAVINGNHSGVNSAYLDYYVNNNPNASHKTNPSETTVYNYAFKLYKKKGNTQTALEGAKFTLYSDAECTKPLKFIKVEESGSTYYRPAVGDEEGIAEIPADFTLRGLDANTYYVKETTTPSGYYAPKGAFKLEIISNLNPDGTHSGKIDAASSSFKNVDPADENLYFGTGIDGDTYIYQAMVKNFSTPNLPTTGGKGTMLLSIGGVALMAAGAYLIFFRKKEN